MSEHITLIEESLLSHIPGKDVKSFADVKEDADAMIKAIEAGEFPGKYPKGFALAHHQVRRNHYRFFVVRSDVAVSMFEGHKVILNPTWKALGSSELTKGREACLSHQYRPTRRKDRENAIMAVWTTIDGEKVEVTLHDIGARIFQHETDHCNGSTIWIDKIAV